VDARRMALAPSRNLTLRRFGPCLQGVLRRSHAPKRLVSPSRSFLAWRLGRGKRTIFRGPALGPYCIATDCTAKRFPKVESLANWPRRHIRRRTKKQTISRRGVRIQKTYFRNVKADSDRPSYCVLLGGNQVNLRLSGHGRSRRLCRRREDRCIPHGWRGRGGGCFPAAARC
jgi:hypothetical protein